MIFPVRPQNDPERCIPTTRLPVASSTPSAGRGNHPVNSGFDSVLAVAEAVETDFDIEPCHACVADSWLKPTMAVVASVPVDANDHRPSFSCPMGTDELRGESGDFDSRPMTSRSFRSDRWYSRGLPTLFVAPNTEPRSDWAEQSTCPIGHTEGYRKDDVPSLRGDRYANRTLSRPHGYRSHR